MRRLIVGITGATGAIFGVRLLQALRAAQVETHLVLSKWGLQTIQKKPKSRLSLVDGSVLVMLATLIKTGMSISSIVSRT